MSAPLRLQALVYDYVENMLERRVPYREAHLAHGQRAIDAGEMVQGGALGDPPTGGLLVFAEGVDVDAWVAEDPYVAAGLIAGHRVEPWTVALKP